MEHTDANVVSDRWAILLRAWLLTGVVDGAFSSVLNVAAYHSTVTRLFQGVASVLIGSRALEGGTRTAIVGVVMHFGVAFGWSAVFLFLVVRSLSLRRLLRSRYGAVTAASIYGPLVWIAMSLVIVPLFTHRVAPITIRWWVQLVGHAPFVGLPIAASIRRGLVTYDEASLDRAKGSGLRA